MPDPLLLVLHLILVAVPAVGIGLAGFRLFVPPTVDQKFYELRLMLLITTACFIWMLASFFVFRQPGLELQLPYTIGTVVVFFVLSVWAGFRGSQLRGKLLLACLWTESFGLLLLIGT